MSEEKKDEVEKEYFAMEKSFSLKKFKKLSKKIKKEEEENEDKVSEQ